MYKIALKFEQKKNLKSARFLRVFYILMIFTSYLQNIKYLHKFYEKYRLRNDLKTICHI